MTIFNVCAKRIYEKEGEKKVKWYKAGILKVTDTGKKYLLLFHQPQNEYHLFEQEPKQEGIVRIGE